MRAASVFVLLMLPLLASCGAAIDPAMQASIDGQVAALSQSSAAFPAPTTKEPMALAPGQWIRIKLVNKDGRPSFMTHKIVGQEGDAVWLEVVTEQYSGRSVSKMLVAYGDRTDPNKMDIRRLIVKMKDRDPIDYQEPLLSIVRGAYKSIAKTIVVKWEGMPQETRKAPAGTFVDAYKADSEVSVLGVTMRARTWYHSAVPIQGLVHADGEDGSVMDLVAFGLTGATSEL